MKELNQALHGNDAAFYTLPEKCELIAQELLLFELGDADVLRKLISDDYTTAIIPIANAVDVKPLPIKYGRRFAARFRLRRFT